MAGVTAQTKTKDLAATLAERGLERTATLFVDTEVRCAGLYIVWRAHFGVRGSHFVWEVAAGPVFAYRHDTHF